jgi:hypothetical protein
MLKDLLRLNSKEQKAAKDIVTINKKKFRFSDWFAEKVIKAVAFI